MSTSLESLAGKMRDVAIEVTILALDPGTAQTGWCLYQRGAILGGGVSDNEDVLGMLRENWHVPDSGDGVRATHLAVERVASYGMAVGREVFETCEWVGRFTEAWFETTGTMPVLVYRRDVKLHMCGTSKAKDQNVRQALIDWFGPGKEKAIGRKGSPGPLYAVKSHAWSALAVALVAEASL